MKESCVCDNMYLETVPLNFFASFYEIDQLLIVFVWHDALEKFIRISFLFTVKHDRRRLAWKKSADFRSPSLKAGQSKHSCISKIFNFYFRSDSSIFSHSFWAFNGNSWRKKPTQLGIESFGFVQVSKTKKSNHAEGKRFMRFAWLDSFYRTIRFIAILKAIKAFTFFSLALLISNRRKYPFRKVVYRTEAISAATVGATFAGCCCPDRML